MSKRRFNEFDPMSEGGQQWQQNEYVSSPKLYKKVSRKWKNVNCRKSNDSIGIFPEKGTSKGETIHWK